MEELMRKMYGYARVSTREQNLDRQILALQKFGIGDRDIIRDKASGKTLDSLPDQTRAEVAKIRSALEKAVTDFYAADPKAIDANTMELLKSGILKPAEYDRLFEVANHGDNATMCRLIAQAAENAVANAKDDNDARQLRYIANRGRNVSGKPYMDAFDSLADTLDRSLRRTYLIPKWDELTANIRENF